MALVAEQVVRYWNRRAAKAGARTVDCGTPSQQRERLTFVAPLLNPELPTLDYGCGHGRWRRVFRGPYLGVDVCASLIAEAREMYADDDFALLRDPHPPAMLSIEPHQVFTCTVLQHNDDACVEQIVKTMVGYPLVRRLIFYENAERQSSHVRGRTGHWYCSLVAGFGYDAVCQIRSHKMRGVRHDCTVVTL